MAKDLKDLDLVDNFLFGTIMSDETAAPVLGRTILKSIFQRDFQKLKIRSEHVIWPCSEKLHGIRLDAYIEENRAELVHGGGEIYDIEPDKRKSMKQHLPRRSRFYHSKIDGALLESGKNYKDLPNVWVIFITNFDPFGANRMVYTIKNQCIELPEMPYEDGSVTLFLYTKGREGNPPENLRKLMSYFQHTVPANAVTQELADIQKIVEQKKLDPKTKEAYMTLQEFINDERDEAVEEEKQRTEAEKQRADSAEQEAAAAREEIRQLKEQLAKLQSANRTEV
ncbi:MAG: hypothetical protein IJW67_06005 [Blautia sp.]|nr:hypothetical protein [Blautia sp.]